ncbi:ubiquitin-associated domain-containing protein 2 [Galendromus occidentalis]|uniref:Ubiquitin-associated domain-containing protein 2 n=1 Tax=Galendromus occidentalis TaxID=34638 RepID=A0AAJ6QUC3_9ACAR|nr:ubiquitin-associated domain-containing protein 2 [Galendromus occidentalis]
MSAPQGFPETGTLLENIPISSGLVVYIVIMRIVIPLFGIPIDPIDYNTESIINDGQFWRILTSKFFFTETRDLISAVFLLFYMRGVERRFGTGKFVEFLLGNFIMTCLVELFMIHLLNYLAPGYLPSLIPPGPFFVFFPMIQRFVTEFPPVSRSSYGSDLPLITPLFLLGTVGIDLAFAPTPIYFPIGCTLLAGALLNDDFLYLKSMIRLPRSLFPKRPCDVSTRKIGATIEAQRSMHSEYLEQQMIYNFSSFRAPRNVVVPPEELVTQLTEMGFNRENAIQALQSTNNNLQMATNILLNQ